MAFQLVKFEKTTRTKTGTTAERTYHIEGLSRGLRVLSALAQQRRRLRLIELAKLTALPSPTVLRILHTLEKAGYVERAADATFAPGMAVLSLGFAALQGSDLVDAASEPMRQLAADTGGNINLGVLRGARVLYLQRIRNADLLTANVQVGSELPAIWASMGKLLLAYEDPGYLTSEIGPTLSTRDNAGPHAVKSLKALAGQLERIRGQGWALQDEELAHGLRSIAAPVRNANGRVVAAVNIAVATSRWSAADLIGKCLGPLQTCVQRISQRLGWFGDLAPPRERKKGS